MTVPAAYFICTSPRSGSTLLCTLLRDTGVAGDPKSYFHRPTLEAWRAGLDLPADTPLADIIETARIAGRGATTLFGLRLQRHSAAFFLDQLRALHPNLPTDAARVEATFGRTRYIHLTRQDKVAQAVSLIRAEQSGLWHRNADGSELERTAPPEALHYDHDAIADQVAEFERFDAEWTAWFADQNITPLVITYDDLSRDPGVELKRALTHLGLPQSHAAPVTPAVAKLADDTNRAWIERYRSAQPKT